MGRGGYMCHLVWLGCDVCMCKSRWMGWGGRMCDWYGWVGVGICVIGMVGLG